MQKKYCPRCNKDISASRHDEDGWHNEYWYCIDCNLAVLPDNDDHGELDCMQQVN